MVERRTPEREVRGFDSHSGRRVVSLSKIHYLPKVLAIHRKCWLRPDIAEKLFAGTLSKTKRNENLVTMVVFSTSNHISREKSISCKPQFQVRMV